MQFMKFFPRCTWQKLCVLLQLLSVPVTMEDSSEQSHWVSPALLSSDPLAGFSSESGLLPPGEEGEAFFSSQDTDYASLPSFFSSNPSHSRTPSSYRHSSGQSVVPPTVLHLPHPLSESWSDFAVLSLSLPLKFDRCSPHRASSVTSSCWTGPAATPWPPPTTLLPTAGAAALSPRPRCTHTPRLPSTLPESPLPSPPPEMNTRLQAERAGRALGSRRPWRPSAWALWGGQEPAAAFWI